MMGIPILSLHKMTIKLMVCENGSKHSESMQLFIVRPIQVDHLRSGSMYMSSILQLHLTFGKMFQIMTTPLGS